jgi:hypothetical protein
MYYSITRGALCSMLIEFVILLKFFGLIELCLNKTYNNVCIGKYLPDTFPILNGMKLGDALLPLVYNFRICH